MLYEEMTYSSATLLCRRAYLYTHNVTIMTCAAVPIAHRMRAVFIFIVVTLLLLLLYRRRECDDIMVFSERERIRGPRCACRHIRVAG